jgi:hypothetical protein
MYEQQGNISAQRLDYRSPPLNKDRVDCSPWLLALADGGGV